MLAGKMSKASAESTDQVMEEEVGQLPITDQMEEAEEEEVGQHQIFLCPLLTFSNVSTWAQTLFYQKQ